MNWRIPVSQGTAKEIWDDYGNQYKENGFVLRFTLFVHLTTSTIATFRSITEDNTDFQIILDQLRSSAESLPDGLQPAACLHGIESGYSEFASAHGSAARTNILVVSYVIEELEYEG